MATSLFTGEPPDKGGLMETVDTYTAVLAVISVALLLVLSGLSKKQLVWEAKRVQLRRRRSR